MNDTAATSRILKNTLFLYIRLGIIMLVKLYTTRILLHGLGIDDYGLWGIIASFVIAFSTVSAPLVASVQRFLNYDMGQGGKQLNLIFSIGFELFLIGSIILFLVLETGGLWFVNYKMNFIPEQRGLVNWVYQFAIFGFVFQLIQKPYEAVIVAYEKMSFYAWISLIEAALLLGNAYLITLDLECSKLRLYSLLTFFANFIVFAIYKFYCRRHFACSKFKFLWDKKLAKEMAIFSGWNGVGSISAITSNEGVNVLLNIFYGVALNAAYGVAQQIKTAAMIIITNIQKAFEPQIVQNYSSGDYERLNSLVVGGLKVSFLLSFIFIFPLLLNMEVILQLWLGETVPKYTYIFSILTLVQVLLLSFDGTIDSVILSTGRIKNYILIVAIINLFNILIIYFLFVGKFGPVSAFFVKILIEIICQIVRLYYLKINLKWNFRFIIKNVIFPLLIVSLATVGITLIVLSFLPLEDKWIRGMVSFIYLPIAIGISWKIILTKQQRNILINRINKIRNKK